MLHLVSGIFAVERRIARIDGDRVVREIPHANQPPRDIAPEIAPPLANGEPMLWENCPHAELPEELVRPFFRRNSVLLSQHRMEPFDVCSICLERPADWGIDFWEHHFCCECARELSQERIEIGFRLRTSMCPFCRREFLLAFPLQNPAHSDTKNSY